VNANLTAEFNQFTVRFQNHPTQEWMQMTTEQTLDLRLRVKHHNFPMGRIRFHVMHSPDWHLDDDLRLYDVGADGNCGFRSVTCLDNIML
jgi:hypothetical protein